MFVKRCFLIFFYCFHKYILSFQLFTFFFLFIFVFLLLVFIMLIFQSFGFSYVGYAFEWLNVVIFILCSLIQQVQNFFMENNDSSDARTVCFCYFWYATFYLFIFFCCLSCSVILSCVTVHCGTCFGKI